MVWLGRLFIAVKTEGIGMRPIMVVVGTRPEGIKMMPVYFALKKANLPVVLCSTDQHSTLLQEVFDLFKVTPDIRLSVMKPGQDLSYVTCAVLQAMKEVYETVNPLLVLVQGDTTTVMASALAAFYQQIPIGHVEAGLRTGDIMSPFPEEANRQMVGLLANYHFTPTESAMANLLAEGKKRETVFYTGNTVVDALQYVQTLLRTDQVQVRSELLAAVAMVQKNQGKAVLVTMHRRESFPDGIMRNIAAMKQYAQAHQDVFFFYPHHPNPVVVAALKAACLYEQKNIFLFPPLAYHELVYLLDSVDCVMTDSGGIQEEAVSLCKPVLVLREKSERMEGVWAGLATIVGTQEKVIIESLTTVLAQKNKFERKERSVYGDGYAADRIARIIQALSSAVGM